MEKKEINMLAFWASVGVRESRGGSYQGHIEALLKKLKHPAKFWSDSNRKLRSSYVAELERREVKRLSARYATLQKLMALKKQGYSNAEIGRRHHITRERVRQHFEWFNKTFVR